MLILSIIKKAALFGILSVAAILTVSFAIPPSASATNSPPWEWRIYWSDWFNDYQYMAYDLRCDGPHTFEITVWSRVNFGDHKAKFCGKVDQLAQFDIKPGGGVSWNDEIKSLKIRNLPSGKCIRFSKDKDQMGYGENWCANFNVGSVGTFNGITSFQMIDR